MSLRLQARVLRAPRINKAALLEQVEKANKELWLVFSLFVIAGVRDTVLASQRMVLGFYTLPTVVSAYLYGRTWISYCPEVFDS